MSLDHGASNRRLCRHNHNRAYPNSLHRRRRLGNPGHYTSTRTRTKPPIAREAEGKQLNRGAVPRFGPIRSVATRNRKPRPSRATSPVEIGDLGCGGRSEGGREMSPEEASVSEGRRNANPTAARCVACVAAVNKAASRICPYERERAEREEAGRGTERGG